MDPRSLLMASFTVAYLTLTSIIQGVALGYLVAVVDGAASKLPIASWLLAVASFLAIVVLWQEYMIGATIFSWSPTLADSLIPFALGAAELAAIHGVRDTHDLTHWLWPIAAGWAIGLFAVAYECIRACEASRSIYLVARRSLRVTAACLGAGVAVSAGTAIALSMVQPSEALRTFVAAVNLAALVAFVLRSGWYLHTLARSGRVAAGGRTENRESSAEPASSHSIVERNS